MPPIVTTSRKHKSKGPVSLLLVVLIVVLVAAVVFFATRKPSSPENSEAGAVEKVSVQTAEPKIPVAVAPVTNKAPAEAIKLTREQELFNKTNNYVKKAGQMLLPDGRVLTFKPPKDGEFRIVHSHGKQYKCDSEGNWEDVTPKPIFDNSFEENLVGLSVEGGTFIPGMLIGLDKDAVMEMLKRDVVINEDDTEDVKAKKEAVAEMKGVILDYIEQGGTFDQFVMEMRSLTVQEKSMKGKALKRIMDLYKEGKYEEAKAYRESFNAVIDEQGFSPIKLPAKVRQALGDQE